MNEALKNHICRFNDSPQVCECFVAGFTQAIEMAIKEISEFDVVNDTMGNPVENPLMKLEDVKNLLIAKLKELKVIKDDNTYYNTEEFKIEVVSLAPKEEWRERFDKEFEYSDRDTKDETCVLFMNSTSKEIKDFISALLAEERWKIDDLKDALKEYLKAGHKEARRKASVRAKAVLASLEDDNIK